MHLTPSVIPLKVKQRKREKWKATIQCLLITAYIAIESSV